MTIDDYVNLLMPAVELVAQRCVDNEEKHTEGLAFSVYHAEKAIGHTVSYMRDLEDDSPTGHAVGAAFNSLMMVLQEVE